MRSLEEYTALATLLGDGIKGKVVIDTTNPLSFPGFEVFWDGNTSAGERIQNVLPDSYVFKVYLYFYCFNIQKYFLYQFIGI